MRRKRAGGRVGVMEVGWKVGKGFGLLMIEGVGLERC